jgi:hypothetical protein
VAALFVGAMLALAACGGDGNEDAPASVDAAAFRSCINATGGLKAEPSEPGAEPAGGMPAAFFTISQRGEFGKPGYPVQVGIYETEEAAAATAEQGAGVDTGLGYTIGSGQSGVVTWAYADTNGGFSDKTEAALRQCVAEASS